MPAGLLLPMPRNPTPPSDQPCIPYRNQSFDFHHYEMHHWDEWVRLKKQELKLTEDGGRMENSDF